MTISGLLPSSILHYSIIICGGGLIGKSLALALRSDPIFDHLSIAIISPSNQIKKDFNSNGKNPSIINQTNNEGKDLRKEGKKRIYSLNSRSINFITNTLGIPLNLHKDKVKPYKEMLVWQRDEFHSAIHFDQPCSMGAIVDGTWLEERVDEKISLLQEKRKSSLYSSFPPSAIIDMIDGRIEGFKYDPRWPWIDGKVILSPSFASSLENSSLSLSSPSSSLSSLPFKCTLMIGADGRESIVKKCTGIQDAFRDYKQKAIIGTVRIKNDENCYNDNKEEWNHKDRPIQRFTSHGPIALLPLANEKKNENEKNVIYANDHEMKTKKERDDPDSKYMSMVWSLDQEMTRNLHLLNQNNWNALIDGAIRLLDADTRYALQSINNFPNSLIHSSIKNDRGHDHKEMNNFSKEITMERLKWRYDSLSDEHLEFNRANRLPEIDHVFMDSISMFPLYFSLPNRTALPNVVLIGDAAHTIHPLAGLGLNMGFEDISTLIESMAPYSKIKIYSGYYEPLRAYEQKRKMQVWPLAMGIDKIERIFSIGGDPDKFIAKYGSIGIRNGIMKMVKNNNWMREMMMRFSGASLHHQSFNANTKLSM